MAAKFEVKKTPGGKWRFVLKAPNGVALLSSQNYAKRSGAVNGVHSVQNNGVEDSRYERKTTKHDLPYFILKARNGQIIGQSKPYSSNSARDNAISTAKRYADCGLISFLE